MFGRKAKRIAELEKALETKQIRLETMTEMYKRLSDEHAALEATHQELKENNEELANKYWDNNAQIGKYASENAALKEENKLLKKDGIKAGIKKLVGKLSGKKQQDAEAVEYILVADINSVIKELLAEDSEA